MGKATSASGASKPFQKVVERTVKHQCLPLGKQIIAGIQYAIDWFRELPKLTVKQEHVLR